MTDLAAVIDRAISRRMRGRLAEFLASYEQVEFGVRRKLRLDEAALVLTTLDMFHLQDSLVSLRIPELNSLCRCLAALAAKDDDVSEIHVFRMRTACFDALHGLKAIEARLSRLLDQHALVGGAPTSQPDPANDK